MYLVRGRGPDTLERPTRGSFRNNPPTFGYSAEASQGQMACHAAHRRRAPQTPNRRQPIAAIVGQGYFRRLQGETDDRPTREPRTRCGSIHRDTRARRGHHLGWRSRLPTTRGLTPDFACRILRRSQTSALRCRNPPLFICACWASDEPRAPTPRQLQHSSRPVWPSAHNVRPVRRLGPSVTATTDHGESVRTDRMDGSTSSASAEGGRRHNYG
jgi:hypothetical protein